MALAGVFSVSIDYLVQNDMLKGGDKMEICHHCGGEFANTKALGSHIHYNHPNYNRQPVMKILDVELKTRKEVQEFYIACSRSPARRGVRELIALELLLDIRELLEKIAEKRR